MLSSSLALVFVPRGWGLWCACFRACTWSGSACQLVRGGLLCALGALSCSRFAAHIFCVFSKLHNSWARYPAA